MKYDYDYSEEIELRDGTRVRLRLLTSADKEKLAKGFEKLSPQSKYSRFLRPKPALTEKELEYFANVDQSSHIAIGAELAEGEREGEGIGVARCIALHKETHIAEAAVTVIDEFQGRGLGQTLLTRLVLAASERGITTFRATLFTQNRAMRQLFDELGQVTVVEHNGPEVTIDIDLQEEAAKLPAIEDIPAGAEASVSEQEQPESSLRRILSLSAREAVSLVSRLWPFGSSDEEEEKQRTEESD